MIESSAAQAVAEISQRFPSLNLTRTEQRVSVSGAAGETGDWAALGNELVAAYAGWDRRSADISLSLNSAGEAAPAPEKTATDTVAGWTPESAIPPEAAPAA